MELKLCVGRIVGGVVARGRPKPAGDDGVAELVARGKAGSADGKGEDVGGGVARRESGAGNDGGGGLARGNTGEGKFGIELRGVAASVVGDDEAVGC